MSSGKKAAQDISAVHTGANKNGRPSERPLLGVRVGGCSSTDVPAKPRSDQVVGALQRDLRVVERQRQPSAAEAVGFAQPAAAARRVGAGDRAVEVRVEPADEVGLI